MAGPQGTSAIKADDSSISGVLGPSGRQSGPQDATSTVQKLKIPEAKAERLLAAAYRALPLMPEEVREQVAAFLTPESMAVIAGVAAVFAGSQFLGVGEVLDVILGGVTVLTVGWDAINALRGFARFYNLAANATSDDEINAAAKCFADAMLTAIAAIGWGRLGKWLGKGVRRAAGAAGAEKAALQIARWRGYIEAIEFKIPKDKGMLWSKLGSSLERADVEAERIAKHHHLTCLELELKKTGFPEMYKNEFGGQKTRVTAEIWKMVSQHYVKSLDGKVTGYVHRARYFESIKMSAKTAAKEAEKAAVEAKGALSMATKGGKVPGALEKAINEFAIRENEFKKYAINAKDPVLVTEIDEISKSLGEIMNVNPRITEVVLIDIKTGQEFGYRSRELMESAAFLRDKEALERFDKAHAEFEKALKELKEILKQN